MDLALHKISAGELRVTYQVHGKVQYQSEKGSWPMKVRIEECSALTKDLKLAL